MPMMRQANTQIATTRTVDRTEGNAQQNTNTTRNSTTRVRDIQFPQVDPKRCQGCGICVNHCPTSAISIKNGKAVINTSICKNCRICMNVCPNNALF
ncbi:MAG: 4Fe-4S dicluster domain-containing protein [Candidatus Heimdallarchaeota archaeon]|nr:4Fe-4S dicluster domain-containing protein [Candidatus Heimdallarchaeota archaeon]